MRIAWNLYVALNCGDFDAAEKVLTFEGIPKRMKLLFHTTVSLKMAPKREIQFCGPRDDEHHTEEATMERYGSLIAMFHSTIAENETIVCDVCHQFTAQSMMNTKDFKLVKKFLPKGFQKKEKVDVCRMCWTDISKKK